MVQSKSDDNIPKIFFSVKKMKKKKKGLVLEVNTKNFITSF